MTIINKPYRFRNIIKPLLIPAALLLLQANIFPAVPGTRFIKSFVLKSSDFNPSMQTIRHFRNDFFAKANAEAFGIIIPRENAPGFIKPLFSFNIPDTYIQVMFGWSTFIAAVIVIMLISFRKRKKIEAELRLSEERLKLALQGSDDGFWDWNISTGNVYFSPRCFEILGYSDTDIPGNVRSWQNLIHSEDLPGVLDELNLHLKGKTVLFSAEYRISTKSGTFKYFLTQGKVSERDSEGKALRMTGTHKDVTERKQFESALKHSEKRFRELADLLPETVFEMDLNGRLTFTNSNAFSCFGYTKEEFENGINVMQTLIPADRERGRSNIAKVLAGIKISTEYTVLRKDGTTFPAIIHSNPIIQNDKPVGLRGFIIDISQRKKIENAIRDSEERYRTLIENQSEGVVIIDLNEKFTYSNSAAENIFGVNPGGLLNRSMNDFVVLEKLETLQEYNKRHKKGKKVSFEIEIIRPDGCNRQIFVRISPFIKKEGKVYGSFAVFMDITERKQAEDQLRKLSMAVSQSPNSIMITDTNGIIEYVNPKFTEITGYCLEEIIGQNPRLLKSGETKPEEYQEMWQKITAGEQWRGEFHNKKKNNELYWESETISPIVNDEGKITHFLAVKEDSTIRKQAEEELIKAKEAAEKSDRLKSEFLAQMSHEIRTPLNSILSFTSLLKEELEDKISDDLKSSFKIIDNGGRRLIRTIDLILNMSQVQTGNYELNSVNTNLGRDIIENVMLEFHSLARERKLEFTYVNICRHDQVIIDQYTVTQIFTNLIDNAIKYTPGGKIEVLLYNNEKDEICVDVKDTGIGISKQYIPFLFTFFSQEETGYTRKFEGNGLGLALIKKYAEMNNAEIRVQSEKGKGSSFTVIFRESNTI